MKKYSFLLKNIGLLTVSNFGTKILSFLLVPLYTRFLSTGAYGTYDLFNSTIMLLIPILTIQISDGVLRFALDKLNNEEQLYAIGMRITMLGFLVLTIVTVIFKLFNIFPIFGKYSLMFLLLYLSAALNQLFENLARGLEKVAALAVSGLLSSIIILTLNVIFLVYMRIGLTGYFLATIIGAFSSCLYLSVSLKVWHYSLFTKVDSKLRNDMIIYSRPLILNAISWWVNNVSDRYIVIWLCGIAANGIYSVGYKIPSILNVFQTIFNQAWTLSSVDEFDPNDKDGFFLKVYNIYNFMMILLCSILIIFTRTIAHLLYAKSFFMAWEYVPFLMIAIVFGSLSGLLGGVFSAVKDSKIFGESTAIGAVVNIALSIILVKFIGPIGAAISTAVSFIIVWALRLISTKKYINLRINIKRDIIVYIILGLQGILILINYTFIGYIIQFIMLIIIITLFKGELKTVIDKVKEKKIGQLN